MPSHDAVFVDSSGWIALLNADDQYHTLAVERLREYETARRSLCTTGWVLAETGNSLARTTVRDEFATTVDRLLKSPTSRLVRVSAEIFESALALYRRSIDKRWGLVDCASFTIMRQERIREALTSDHHFVQAGFRRLLGPTAK
jgi:uncharacterized protein